MRVDPDASYLPIAVRAYALAAGAKGDEDPRPISRQAARIPNQVLIFDTETSTNSSQRLNFGSWRYYRIGDDQQFRCAQEGIFYDENLPERDSRGFAALERFAASNPRPQVDPTVLDASRRLHFWPLKRFLDSVLWPASYQVAGLVACFNFPFDVSRVAWKVGTARNPHPDKVDGLAGGFSFALWRYRDRSGRWKESSQYRPRVAIKSIDSKRALKGFRTPAEIDPLDIDTVKGAAGERRRWAFRGHFVDLRTLAYVLTNESHSLESACEAFGVPYRKRDVEHGTISAEYVDYCREDVAASAKVCERMLKEFLRHPVSLPVTRAYSPATLGKSYLKEMGVAPILKRQRFDHDLLGWAMSAYYGGRAETRIRKTAVPVVYTDFASMYPTVCSLINAWGLLTANEIEVVNSTVDVRDLLSDVTVESALDPSLWLRLQGIARIVPNGDVLPVRATYGPGRNWQIGLNPVSSGQPLWYSIADLVASKLLSGRTPRVEEAVSLLSAGQLDSLRPVRLLGEIEVDPAMQDFFRILVEERRRVGADLKASSAERDWREEGLKVLANAASYGIYAQMIQRDAQARRGETVNVHGLYSFQALALHPEDPGEYCFPPLAASITAGARLMLASLECLVRDAGGTYAFCDTDSMAIVATETGGLVRCPGGAHSADGQAAVRSLSWAEVEQIRQRFERLNPYSRDAVPGSILELEKENFDSGDGKRRQLWCYAISAKRYALFEQATTSGIPILRKVSQHGLGHLLNPVEPDEPNRDWIDQVWESILSAESPFRAELPWLDRPAVARSSVSTPRLHALFQRAGQADYQLSVKPFNFLNSVFVSPLEKPEEQHIALIAPYETDPSKWMQLPWVNRYTGMVYRLTTKPSHGLVWPGMVTVKSYRQVLREFVAHPEDKSLGPDGNVCRSATQGLLQRRPVTVAWITHIGKESNRLDEALQGIIQDHSELITEYEVVPGRVFSELIAPILREIGTREVARKTGMSPSSVSYALTGKKEPRPKTRERYLRVAFLHAREALLQVGVRPPGNPLGCLRLYLDTR